MVDILSLGGKLSTKPELAKPKAVKEVASEHRKLELQLETMMKDILRLRATEALAMDWLRRARPPEKLKALREEANLTLTVMADSIEGGRSAAYLHNIEKGRQLCPAHAMRAYLALEGVDNGKTG